MTARRSLTWTQWLLLLCAATALLISLCGPLLAPYGIDDIADMPFAPPSADHWLGTDYLGADVLSRLLVGGHELIVLGLAVVVSAWLIGGALAMLSTLRGGWLERLVLSVVDVLQSLPSLVVLMVTVALLGAGYRSAACAAVLISAVDIIRIARAATLQAMQHDYVDIARLRGESTLWILAYEIAPNLWPLVVADVGVRFIAAVFIMATASFLGLGAQPPMADWGLMIMENSQGLGLQPLAVLAPVGALLLLLVPANLLLDGIVARPRGPKRYPKAPLSRQSVCTAPCSDVLDIRSLSIHHADQPLLQQVSLALEAGDVVALIGASGSGKTTLLHAALGELPHGCHATQGGIWLAGEDMLAIPSARQRLLRRRYVGYLPQDARAALLPFQRVGLVLQRRARALGLPRAARTARLLQQLQDVGLPADAAFLRRYPHQLSGGQRQRIMLALALLGQPRLLVLDEPASALDSIATQSLYTHIRRIARQRGIAVLMVAHGLEQAASIADRFIVLEEGRIAEQSRVADFLAAPTSLAGRRLMRAQRRVSVLGSERPSPTSSPILSVQSLECGHGATAPLWQDVGFRLARGGCLSIVGESGCGKTTLLRCLLGLHTASAGSLTLHGRPLVQCLNERTCEQQRCLQYVPQDPYDSLNPFWSVRALLGRLLHLFSPELPRAAREQALANAMQRVGLPESLLSVKVQRLSGGQRQRVALARALLATPDVLLCDEVTSALDSERRNALLDVLDHLRRERQMTLIMVTHDMAVPARLGGDILVMGEGGIVERGAVGEVFAAPKHPVTHAMLAYASIGGAQQERV
ncbi:ABC transporter ATP-binding protein/permease [Zymobacter palmae]|uniref:Peptide/nickel transport system ATP-binding protein n=1 Tax=Zymobacter palmae TaxID=33074 RepID=A0A348HDA5_9GAMM|nr:ATP-binding cassette domain-containing protein [Zymobacter palmae]BBG29607.1 peptide/nickel transport system ATP-binding protein [Zymobacter palmae]